MKAFVFGEVLFDVYPQESVIGGAPFNFAAHLAQCGIPVSLISAVGKDNLADTVMQNLEHFSVGHDFCSVVAQPTGICQVSISNGNPSYDLKPDMAYDNIPVTDAMIAGIAATHEKLLYFGTLALRDERSKASLCTLLERCSWNEVLFDINIRQKYYSKETVELGLSHCTVLKFSREEAKVFTELGISKTDYLLPLCKTLTHRYPNIHTVLLTLDADGAVVYDAKNDHYTPSKVPNCKVVSTVGAGDSFFAGYTASRLKQNDIKTAVDNAVSLSSYVVEHLEAVPEYRDSLDTIFKNA